MSFLTCGEAWLRSGSFLFCGIRGHPWPEESRCSWRRSWGRWLWWGSWFQGKTGHQGMGWNPRTVGFHWRRWGTKTVRNCPTKDSAGVGSVAGCHLQGVGAHVEGSPHPWWVPLPASGKWRQRSATLGWRLSGLLTLWCWQRQL